MLIVEAFFGLVSAPLRCCALKFRSRAGMCNCTCLIELDNILKLQDELQDEKAR